MKSRVDSYLTYQRFAASLLRSELERREAGMREVFGPVALPTVSAGSIRECADGLAGLLDQTPAGKSLTLTFSDVRSAVNKFGQAWEDAVQEQLTGRPLVTTITTVETRVPLKGSRSGKNNVVSYQQTTVLARGDVVRPVIKYLPIAE